MKICKSCRHIKTIDFDLMRGELYSCKLTGKVVSKYGTCDCYSNANFNNYSELFVSGMIIFLGTISIILYIILNIIKFLDNY